MGQFVEYKIESSVFVAGHTACSQGEHCSWKFHVHMSRIQDSVVCVCGEPDFM